MAGVDALWNLKAFGHIQDIIEPKNCRILEMKEPSETTKLSHSQPWCRNTLLILLSSQVGQRLLPTVTNLHFYLWRSSCYESFPPAGNNWKVGEHREVGGYSINMYQSLWHIGTIVKSVFGNRQRGWVNWSVAIIVGDKTGSVVDSRWWSTANPRLKTKKFK